MCIMYVCICVAYVCICIYAICIFLLLITMLPLNFKVDIAYIFSLSLKIYTIGEKQA